MKLTMYHNPRCSKSRQTLEIIRERGHEPTLVLYLQEPPAAATTLKLAELLGVSVAELMRTGESDYKEATDLPGAEDDAALAAWLEAHPKVLQRPIVVDDSSGRAVIGRPPENVLELLDND